MDIKNSLSIIGALCGSLGSIISVFSLNKVVYELNLARRFIEVTVCELAHGSHDIHVFDGLDERFSKASRWGFKVSWVGIVLLVIGFLLQSICIVFTL